MIIRRAERRAKGWDDKYPSNCLKCESSQRKRLSNLTFYTFSACSPRFLRPQKHVGMLVAALNVNLPDFSLAAEVQKLLKDRFSQNHAGMLGRP